MPTIAKHALGSFCWADVATHDVAKLKAFYGAVLGWRFEDVPIGDGDVYSVCLVDGRPVCGIKERSTETFVPQWISYLAVEDARATLQKAETLGAEIIVTPVAVGELGHMALLKDPSLAIVGLWQPNKLAGSSLVGERHTRCWTDLRTRNTDAASDFYTSLFGWTARTSPGPLEYTLFSSGVAPVGGMVQMPPEIPLFIPAHWLPYVAVANADAAVESVKSAGGKLMAAPMEIPDVGRVAAVGDATGTVFAMLESNAS